MTNTMIKKFTTAKRTFKFSSDNKFIKVYFNGKLNGFIWNTDKVIVIDGNEVKSNLFFN